MSSAQSPRILGLIPARGGSKGIPRKNVKLISGKPLIAWTIEAALRSRQLAAVVVSTDDAEIADVARRYGAQVPFMRPAELAQDGTPGLDPVLHALECLPQYDNVMLLQPTSPLRTTEDIDACISLRHRSGAPAAVSVTEPERHPFWMYTLGQGGGMHPLMNAPAVTRRQELPPVYAANGALYYTEAGWLRAGRAFITPETVAYIMPADRSVDLDTPLDWKLAELLLKEQTS